MGVGLIQFRLWVHEWENIAWLNERIVAELG